MKFLELKPGDIFYMYHIYLIATSEKSSIHSETCTVISNSNNIIKYTRPVYYRQYNKEFEYNYSEHNVENNYIIMIHEKNYIRFITTIDNIEQDNKDIINKIRHEHYKLLIKDAEENLHISEKIINNNLINTDKSQYTYWGVDNNYARIYTYKLYNAYKNNKIHYNKNKYSNFKDCIEYNLKSSLNEYNIVNICWNEKVPELSYMEIEKTFLHPLYVDKTIKYFADCSITELNFLLEELIDYNTYFENN